MLPMEIIKMIPDRSWQMQEETRAKQIVCVWIIRKMLYKIQQYFIVDSPSPPFYLFLSVSLNHLLWHITCYGETVYQCHWTLYVFDQRPSLKCPIRLHSINFVVKINGWMDGVKEVISLFPGKGARALKSSELQREATALRIEFQNRHIWHFSLSKE